MIQLTCEIYNCDEQLASPTAAVPLRHTYNYFIEMTIVLLQLTRYSPFRRSHLEFGLSKSALHRLFHSIIDRIIYRYRPQSNHFSSIRLLTPHEQTQFLLHPPQN